MRVAVQHDVGRARTRQAGQHVGVPGLQRDEQVPVEYPVTFQCVQCVVDLFADRGEPRQPRVTVGRDVQPGQRRAELGPMGAPGDGHPVLPERENEPSGVVWARRHQRRRRDDRPTPGCRPAGDGNLAGQPGRGVAPSPCGQRRDPGKNRGGREVHQQVAPLGEHARVGRRQPQLASHPQRSGAPGVGERPVLTRRTSGGHRTSIPQSSSPVFHSGDRRSGARNRGFRCSRLPSSTHEQSRCR